MLWLAAALAQGPGTSVSPVDAASSSIVGYVLSYGPVGIVALALGWLLFRGWRLISPSGETAIRGSARADLIAAQDRMIRERDAERDRILGEKHEAERQRDEAMRLAQDQLIPLLLSFTSATQSLLPLLQNLISQRGGGSP